jgi:hypothetical protein
MESLVVTSDGLYEFVSELSAAQLELLSDRALFGARECDELIVIEDAPVEAHGCWWFHEDGCSGKIACGCGPVTLLDVLDDSVGSVHQQIIRTHLAHVVSLYNHFWATEDGENNHDLSNACPGCIIDGPEHGISLLAGARELGAELAEAMAAYHVDITLGSFRY